MGLHEKLDRVIDRAIEIPVLRHVLKFAYDKKFTTARNAHMFKGVYCSFEEALQNLPNDFENGYDNPASAEMYLHRLVADEYDYPPLFWLSKSISCGMRSIVDLGGSVGIKYYAFSKLIDFPVDLQWTVVDVPAAVIKGRDFAKLNASASKIHFSDNYQSGDGVDILFCSGSLQYLPLKLKDIVSAYFRYPKRIIVNTTAIHPTESFFTVNNIGTAFCAYRVQSRGAFIDEMQAMGYALRDSWTNLGKSMSLRFEKGYSIHNYSGFCFDLVGHENVINN